MPAAIDVDPRVNSVENPFACLGGYEALTGAGRSLDEIEDELRALLGRIEEDAARAATRRALRQRAVDLCVAGRLKARLGQGDAAGLSSSGAIAAAPREPGFELFAGMYWAGDARGPPAPAGAGRAPLLQRACASWSACGRAGRRWPFHDTVEDWLHKQLLVLYQQDGAQLLPWKAYHQSGAGLWAPGLAFSYPAAGGPGHAATSSTTARCASSPARRPSPPAICAPRGSFDERDAWDIARAPRRFETDQPAAAAPQPAGGARRRPRLLVLAGQPDPQLLRSQPGVLRRHRVPAGPGLRAHVLAVPAVRLSPGRRLPPGAPPGRGRVRAAGRSRTSASIEVSPSFSRFIGANTLTLDLSYVLLDFQARSRAAWSTSGCAAGTSGRSGWNTPSMRRWCCRRWTGGELGWERTPHPGLALLRGGRRRSRAVGAAHRGGAGGLRRHPLRQRRAGST